MTWNQSLHLRGSIRRSFIRLVVFSLIALASLILMAQTQPAHAATKPSICYEVQDANNGWLPEVCDNALVSAPNGITGLNVTLKNANGRSVAYQAYYNNSWQANAKDGGLIGNGTDVFKAVRILLSPRNGMSVTYLVVDDQFTTYQAANDQPAGNKTNDLKLIRIGVQ